MTNAEKRGQEILEQLCKTGDWAVENYTNKIMNCSPASGNCQKCIFDVLNRKCWEAKAEWLNSEYKTKKHFTEADKAVLRALDKVQWVVRDMFDTIEGYGIKPEKGARTWYNKFEHECTGDESAFVCLSSCSSATFTDIKWEDKEPTSREEILGEEK